MSKYTTEQIKEILLGDYNVNSQLIIELYGGRKEFPYELQYISLDDKIRILDKHTEGKSTYVLNLLEQFNTDKETLPQDRGRIKTVSLKAWIRKNIDSNIVRVDDNYHYGRIYFLGIEHYIQEYFNYKSAYGYDESDYREKLFISLINNVLKQKEREWYRENNPLIKKINELKEYTNLSTFNSKILNDIHWNGKEDITEEQADFYISIEKEFKEYEKMLADKVAEYELKNELK